MFLTTLWIANRCRFIANLIRFEFKPAWNPGKSVLVCCMLLSSPLPQIWLSIGPQLFVSHYCSHNGFNVSIVIIIDHRIFVEHPSLWHLTKKHRVWRGGPEYHTLYHTSMILVSYSNTDASKMGADGVSEWEIHCNCNWNNYIIILHQCQCFFSTSKQIDIYWVWY